MYDEFLWSETIQHKIAIEGGGNQLTGYWLKLTRDGKLSESITGLGHTEMRKMFAEMSGNMAEEVKNAIEAKK